MQSSERLKSLFLQTPLASPIILLGAGASLKSGIPLSGQVVEIAAKWAYCQNQGFHLEDPSVRRSDWLKWLERHSWYDGVHTMEDNYSVALERLLQPRENRKQFFIRLLEPDVLNYLVCERCTAQVDANQRNAFGLLLGARIDAERRF